MIIVRLFIVIFIFTSFSCMVKKTDGELIIVKLVSYSSANTDVFNIRLSSDGMISDELGHFVEVPDLKDFLFKNKNEYIAINLYIGSGIEDEKIPFSVVGKTLNDLKKLSIKMNRKIIVYIPSERIE